MIAASSFNLSGKSIRLPISDKTEAWTVTGDLTVEPFVFVSSK